MQWKLVITLYQSFIMTKKEDHNKNNNPQYKQSAHRNKQLPCSQAPQLDRLSSGSFGMTDQFQDQCLPTGDKSTRPLEGVSLPSSISGS